MRYTQFIFNQRIASGELFHYWGYFWNNCSSNTMLKLYRMDVGWSSSTIVYFYRIIAIPWKNSKTMKSNDVIIRVVLERKLYARNLYVHNIRKSRLCYWYWNHSYSYDFGIRKKQTPFSHTIPNLNSLNRSSIYHLLKLFQFNSLVIHPKRMIREWNMKKSPFIICSVVHEFFN